MREERREADPRLLGLARDVEEDGVLAELLEEAGCWRRRLAM